jgi:ribosomal protein S18 acetylase RimI-like enzyme
MEIRQATESDIESIEQVARETWETDYPTILHRETVDEEVEEWYNDDQLETELEEEDAILLVAETDGEVVGFTHAVRRRRTGYILRVYVAPDHRGEGVGSELLTSARDVLLTRGVDNVRAMVLAENEPGNAFYQSFGFEKVDDEETVIGGDTYTENVYERKR